MRAGRSVVYADFVGYDEVAHHSGVERYDALETLRRLDREFARLERAAAGCARPYEFVVLSDHGQSQGATFRTRYGQTLEDVVRHAMGAPTRTPVDPHSRAAGEESWGYAGGALEEIASGSGMAARAASKAANRHRAADGDVLLGPESGSSAPVPQQRATDTGQRPRRTARTWRCARVRQLRSDLPDPRDQPPEQGAHRRAVPLPPPGAARASRHRFPARPVRAPRSARVVR